MNISQIIKESANIKKAMLISCLGDIDNAVKILINASTNNKKILWCGNGGSDADVVIKIPSNDTQRIQEGHLLVEHILCESVEEAILGK